MSFSSPILIVAAVAVIYALPGIIAVVRGRRSQWAILGLDILLGWTVVGWIAAGYWALAPEKPRAAKSARPARTSPILHARRDDRFANDNAAARARRSKYLWDDERAQPDAGDYAAWLDSGAAVAEPSAPATCASDTNNRAA